MIKIYRGDSTDFADLSSISVTIDTEVDITGFTGKFSFGGIEKTFPPIEIEQRTFQFNYTYEETSTFCLGKGFGTFYLFDTKGRKAVVTKVLVDVILPHEYEPHDNKFIVNISNSINYETLFNKPSINGVTINGNHDGRHYGLQNIALYDETSSYTINEQVVFENALWLCVANTGPGEFDVSKWTCLGSSIRTFPNAEAFPIVGISGVLYIDLQTKYVYVWSTTSYALLSTNLNPYLLGSAAAPEWNPGDTSHTVVSYRSHLYRHPSTWEQGEDTTLPPTENQRWAEVTLLDLLGEKVDKVQGYGLSKNDFTDALKTKLEGVEENANNYTLPPATAQTLGGIKVGNNLSVDENGTVSADAQPQEQANWNETNTESPSYIKNKPGTATTQNAGLMSAADKATLDKIDAAFPSGASAQNELADKDFVNSSVATNTATFRGTYNLINDLGLTLAATEQQIASAIATKLASLVPPIVPENNDYCFVQIPTKDSTPTEIARVDRYKCTVTESGGVKTRVWGYEWSLNNSSFTAAQWAAINSGITAADVSKLEGIEAGAQVNIINSVKVNGSTIIPDSSKAVDLTVPVITPPTIDSSDSGKAADAQSTAKELASIRTTEGDDVSRCYSLWEESLTPNNRAHGNSVIYFTPTAFGATSNCVVRRLTVRTSDSGSGFPTVPVYAKIIDPDDTSAAIAVSQPVMMTAINTDYDFVFGESPLLTYTKQYRIVFYSGASDGSPMVSVALRLYVASSAQSIYFSTNTTWRPITKWVFSQNSIVGSIEGIKTLIPSKATIKPSIAGTAAIGTSTQYATADHIHPSEVQLTDYSLPLSNFPITYSYGGSSYTINNNGGLLIQEDVATSSIFVRDRATSQEIAWFDGNLTYQYSNTSQLLFNGVSPIANSFPILSTNPAVIVHDETEIAQTIDLSYAMPSPIHLIPSNGIATITLGDRTVTTAIIASGVTINVLRLVFPMSTANRVRDFFIRVEVASGVTAPSIAMPSDVTIETSDGTYPTISDGGVGYSTTTLVYFMETKANTFVSKTETVISAH